MCHNATFKKKKKNLPAHLSIDDKDQRSSSLEDHLTVKRGVKEVHLTGEVPDLEVHKGATGDVVLVDFIGAFQEQGLIRRHLVENNLSGLKTNQKKQ